MIKAKIYEGKGKIKYSGSVNELYLDVSYLLYSLSAALNEDEKGKGDELMQKLKWYMNLYVYLLDDAMRTISIVNLKGGVGRP